MLMLIYNSLSEKKEPLKKPRLRPLKIFVCGPTVYDYAHLGHARTYIFFDTFVRFLKSRGFKVKYLQNITDIDDKIIERAQLERKTPQEIASFFEQAYYADMKKLKVSDEIIYAPASRFINEIVKQVQKLIAKGFAYKIDGEGYYFDISKFKDYGKLSHRTVEAAEDATSRIDESVNKRNKGDFALWKFPKNKFEPTWDTPLGRGRPGWHIEDTAISEKFFGPQYDIHGGGIDLKFPHHEAEIAQQEAASGKVPFVKIWMHTGFLLVNGQKMSKSRKNFITIREFLEKYPPEVLRFMVLNYHYRSPLDYSAERAKEAKQSLTKIIIFLSKLDDYLTKKAAGPQNIRPAIQKTKQEIDKAMADDFNTPRFVAAIFKLIEKYQNRLPLIPSEARKLKSFITTAFLNLGLELNPFLEIPPEIEKKRRQIDELRRNQQFVQSDTLRKELKSANYIVENTPWGTAVAKDLEINGQNKNKNSSAGY